MTDAASAGTPYTVFLDRDGVLNKHPRVAVRRWEQWRWLPGAREALAQLNRPDVRTCLVTNQPTVGLGLTRRSAILSLHLRMLEEIRESGGRLDRVEVAFEPWSRRFKPRPGMLEDAASAFAQEGPPVVKDRATMVGDKPKDALAAAAFGIPIILVATTYDRAYLQEHVTRLGVKEACVVDDLMEAKDEILARIEDPDRARRSNS